MLANHWFGKGDAAMGQSKRHWKDIGSLPAISSERHRWTVGKATHGGAPLLLRVNGTAREWLGHPDLPVRVGFAVPLNEPRDGGLPTPEENDQLGDIEDVVRAEVEERSAGVHALVLTTGRMREWVFYLAEGADIGAIHTAVRGRVRSHQVQCKAVIDPDWDSYTRFAGE
jgi:hypothetical protein